MKWRIIDPIPCMHIYEYYNHMWQANHQLGSQLLRRGYYQCATGRIESINNLYESE